MAGWLQGRSLTGSVDLINGRVKVKGRYGGRGGRGGSVVGRSGRHTALHCHAVAMLLALIALSLNSVAMWQTSKVDMLDYLDEDEPEESFCSYEGYVKTERNWFGFLANLTVTDTGRLMFEFRYPADRCCLNILFYTGDQLSGISTRINCWQREELLHPEDDQILRLTPSFSWSGCRLTRSAGVPTYVCKGGRTLSNDRGAATEDPHTWYVAVSNCAALYGLELTYRLELHGPVTSCPAASDRVFSDTTWRNPWTFTTTGSMPAKAVSMIPRQAELTLLEKDQSVCIVEGEVNTTKLNWAGFFRNLTFVEGGGFRYEFSYPYDMQIQNVLLYDEEDVRQLRAGQNCWEKESVIQSLHIPDKILDLSYRSTWFGCSSRNGQYNINLTCSGVRRFDEPQKVFMAVSNCRSHRGILLYYRLGVFGFKDEDLCNRNQTTFLHRQLDCYIFVVSILLLQFSLWKESGLQFQTVN